MNQNKKSYLFKNINCNGYDLNTEYYG